MLALVLAALILVIAFTAFIVWAAVTPAEKMLDTADRMEKWGDRMVQQAQEAEDFYAAQQFDRKDWGTQKRRWGYMFATMLGKDPSPYLIDPHQDDDRKWDRLRAPTQHLENDRS